MPVEVISLLSSSGSSSPPPQTAQQQGQTSSPLRAATELHSDDFTALSDLEIPPRSPALPISNRADDIWVLTSDEERGSPRPTRQSPNSLGFGHEGPVSKRRRLDPSSDSRPVSASGSAAPAQHEILRAWDHGRLNSANVGQPAKRINWLENDPFATSSPRPAEPDRSQIDVSCPNPQPKVPDDNPFVSSPPRQPAKTSIGRTILDEIDPFASSSPGLAPRATKPTQTAASWDPISSSAPIPATADHELPAQSRSLRRTQSAVISLDDSDNECGAHPGSDDEFPDITSLPASQHRPASRLGLSAVSHLPKAAKTSQTKASAAGPKKSSTDRTKEREEKAAAREAEKERKRLEKERAKEERAHGKARAAALAEVNKLRTDKKVSTPEMIVDLPATLDQTTKVQAETLLRNLDVLSTAWPSPVENVVRWRRRVRSRYNDELGLWEPIPERIERENYSMVIVPATQFVDLALGQDAGSLESHVLRMRRHFPGDTIIYLIEGLEVWLRRNRNVRNRQFVSAVRSGLEPQNPPPPPPDVPNLPPPSAQAAAANPRRRTQQPPQTYIDEETIEQALLTLQVHHHHHSTGPSPSSSSSSTPLLIHHTALPLETARQIAVFTQHISTAPYRRQRDASHDTAGAAFCMDSGQVRTGDGARDTYARLLQEIARVTAPVAYGIAAQFPTVPALVKWLERGGPLALEKVRKGVNKEGEVGERVVGQAVSRRVYKIFVGRDEGSTDI